MNLVWHALNVRQRFERIAVLHLRKQNIENYLPLQRVSRSLSNGIRTIELPLFPGYVFCKWDGKVPRASLTIPGVLSKAWAADSIDAVSSQEMDDLRRVLSSGLHYAPWPFTPGKPMTVKDGPLCGVTGLRADARDKRWFILPIKLIHRSVAVDVGNSGGLSVDDKPLAQLSRRS